MADSELVGGGLGTGAAENLLAGLLTHKDVQFWRYSDEGPPPGTRKVMSMSGQPVAAGWVVSKAGAPPGERTTHTVAWAIDDVGHQMGLTGEPVLAASTDSRTKAYETLDPDQASARRIADAVAACAARQVKADLYVTKREYLHRLTRLIGEGVTFCTVEEALALVGLYLRSRGNFLLWKEPSENTAYRFDKGLYYWVGARELLPAGWRWFSACVLHDQSQGSASGADELTYLGGAVFQRITRVLQARDDLLRAMNCEQDNNVAEDALIALDVCLIFLMGAVDATARVAHHVLGLLHEGIHQAGWQRPKWLKQVAAKAPMLAQIVAPETPGADALTILRLLRNTVHDTGLPALAIGLPGRREGTLAGLPSAARDQILEAADRQGGRQGWGLREPLPGRLHADPYLLLERLLPAVIELLNDLMAATPVEKLSGISLKPEHSAPPGGKFNKFGERERQSIRWQLGL